MGLLPTGMVLFYTPAAASDKGKEEFFAVGDGKAALHGV